MAPEQSAALIPGTELLHKRYGPVRVDGYITDKGPILTPMTETGKRLLAQDSGIQLVAHLIEGDPSQINFITKESVAEFRP